MRFILIAVVLAVVLLFGCTMKPGYGIWNPNVSSSPAPQAEQPKQEPPVNPYPAYIGAPVGCNTNNTTVYCYSNNPSGQATSLTLKVWEVGTYTNSLYCEKTVEYNGSKNIFVSCDIDPSKQYTYVGTENLKD